MFILNFYCRVVINTVTQEAILDMAMKLATFQAPTILLDTTPIATANNRILVTTTRVVDIQVIPNQTITTQIVKEVKGLTPILPTPPSLLISVMLAAAMFRTPIRIKKPLLLDLLPLQQLVTLTFMQWADDPYTWQLV